MTLPVALTCTQVSLFMHHIGNTSIPLTCVQVSATVEFTQSD